MSILPCMPAAAVVELTAAERETLLQWSRAGSAEHRRVERARIILLASEGLGTRPIARQLRTRAARVSKWRRRFARDRLAGPHDRPRSGKPARYDRETETRILAQLDQPPPPGGSQRSGPLLARALPGISDDQIWRVLRRHKIHLQRRRSGCVSTDPEFAQKAAEVVGLYLHPPENTVVLWVDEKPHIQALERAQGAERVNHCYTRHGTTTLFAVLEVASGDVQVGHYHRRRRELHVMVDNLSTHKPKRDRRLARHPNVHLHFIPTHASWLNLVEVWFSILSRQALHHLSCTHARQLREAIDKFVCRYRETAAPFEWTKTEVHPSRPSSVTLTYASSTRRPASGSGLSLHIPSRHCRPLCPRGDRSRTPRVSRLRHWPSPRSERLGSPIHPAIRF